MVQHERKVRSHVPMARDLLSMPPSNAYVAYQALEALSIRNVCP